ncbi:MAG TPA: hypothetical protein VFJ16_07105 [Longimicrobium sp.]|nr:hypothetical protein [Longimicrobium sp.]
METTTQPLAVLKFSKTKDGTPVLSITRRDGSVAWQKQHDFFPMHDLTHYAIETTLGLRQAFWGMMADGWEFGDFGTPWPRGPMPNVPEALLAEVSAGWFDSFARHTADDGEGAGLLNAHLAEYCAQHGHPSPRTITADEFGRIRRLRDELQARWHALGPREAMELEFNVEP